MSDQIILEATRRDVFGKKVKQMRREGKLPAVVYGYGVEPTPITLNLREASKILRTVGSSTLVTLKIDGEEYATLVREEQKGIISREYEHIDFQAINMDVSVRTQVPIVVVGEDIPVVRDFGAYLITGFESLEIECLPKDLPDQIEVDATVLENIGDIITLADLELPSGVTALDDPETMIVVATAPDAAPAEDEEEELDEDELGLDEPEVIEKGKGEEEEEA